MKVQYLIKKRKITRLTYKDRIALKYLLENGRMSDSQIAKSIGISPVAARKIRLKLEDFGLIKKYFVELNYSAVGVNIFALALLDIPGFESEYENKTLSSSLIKLYRFPKNDITHIAIFGFKDIQELYEYFNTFKEGGVRIKKVYMFSEMGLLKNSKTQLFVKSVMEFGKNGLTDQIYDKTYTKQKSMVSKHNLKKISLNEIKVLKSLVDDCRGPFTKISTKVGIGSRAVGRIKDKLEKAGIIDSYSVDLDYEILGLNVFSFIFLKRINNDIVRDNNFRKLVNKLPEIIGCYEVAENQLYVLLCGFRDLYDLERFVRIFPLKDDDSLKIVKICITSNRGVIKDTSDDLYKDTLGRSILK